MQSVTRDPAMRCVDEYFECIERANGSLPNNMDKAKVQAFLASRDRPGLLVGQAAAAGYWPWTSDAFSHVRRFIQNLEP